MSDSNYGMVRVSFSFLRGHGVQQLKMIVSWKWTQSVSGVHWVSVFGYHILHINNQYGLRLTIQ